jgi:hypothetical protein
MVHKFSTRDCINLVSGFALGAMAVLAVQAWQQGKSGTSDSSPPVSLAARRNPPAVTPFPSNLPVNPAIPAPLEKRTAQRKIAPTAPAVIQLPTLPGQHGVLAPEAVSEESTAFAAIFAMPEGEEQTTAFEYLVKSITPEKAELWHKAWMRGPYMQAETEMTHLYNCRIGEVYGPVVVGVRDGYGPKDMMGADWFVKDQFQGWIRSDPAAAEKWLDGLQHPEFRAAMERAWDESAQASEAAARGEK